MSLSSKRKSLSSDNDEDDIPLSARKKIKKEVSTKKKKTPTYSEDEYDSEVEHKKVFLSWNKRLI